MRFLSCFQCIHTNQYPYNFFIGESVFVFISRQNRVLDWDDSPKKRLSAFFQMIDR